MLNDTLVYRDYAITTAYTWILLKSFKDVPHITQA